METDGLQLAALPGAVPAWHGTVDALEWQRVAEQVSAAGGALVALWGSDESDRGLAFAVHAALSTDDGLLWLTLPVSGRPPEFPDLVAAFPAAVRMQRAIYDLLGIRAAGTRDARRWLRHGAWPADVFPLRKAVDGATAYPNSGDEYAFVPVEGEGVHEIPVGPVHAGTIEPGHFRFSIVGERTLRLEQRLGYKHKGIEKRFEALNVHDAYRLAGRVSGDSTVAYAWAYAMAVESAAALTPPPRAHWLRALLLERERIANHLGDLGFLGNDAGLAFGLMQMSRLKEEWLRTNAKLFGHRYLMDMIIPGGVTCDVHAGGGQLLREEIDYLREEVKRIKSIFDEHPGLQDRFATTGRVSTELARQLGLTGLAARASGRACDVRANWPAPPYDELQVRMVTHPGGDVAARVNQRFEEILESLALCDQILSRIPQGNVATLFAAPEAGHRGVGWVEGWRGDVLIALETGDNGALRRVHAHDPSWQNWPLLEHAVIGNIVPDFPLINKSFNLSYSGADL